MREVTGKQVSRGELHEVLDIDSVFAAVATRAIGDDPREFVTLMADDDLEAVNQVEHKKEDRRGDEERKNLHGAGATRTRTFGIMMMGNEVQ